MLDDPTEKLIELELEVMGEQREIEEILRTLPYNFNLATNLNRRQSRLAIKMAEIERLKKLISNPEAWQ